MTGVPAQGRANPQSAFKTHRVVLVGPPSVPVTQIYDPSYGLGPFGTWAEYEQAAFAGYVVNGLTIPEPDEPRSVIRLQDIRTVPGRRWLSSDSEGCGGTETVHPPEF
jgi:hypothetical protein